MPPGWQPRQRTAQVLADCPFDVARIGHHRVQRTIFLQPLGSGFGAHFVDAWHVVHRVAHQNLVVHHQARGHAEFRLHTGQVAALAVHGVDDGNVLIDQLRQVFVAAGDDDLDALPGCDDGQRANDVVGLHAGHVQHGPAQQAHHFVDRRDLAAQIVRHGRTLRLVLRIDRVAKRGAFGVEHASRIVAAHFLAQALHHVDHAPYRARGRTGGVARYGAQIGHGMECTVQVAGAIDQQQGFLVAHGCILPLMRTRFAALQCRDAHCTCLPPHQPPQ